VKYYLMMNDRKTYHLPRCIHLAQSMIPSALPPLPPATRLPWSAEVIEAHRGLVSTFGTSYRALNLDESDPIRLGHHLKQADTFMASIIDVLSVQEANPLPNEYIETVRGAVTLLVDGLRVALNDATSAFVVFLSALDPSSYRTQ